MSRDDIDNDKILDLITCAICLDIYVDPRMLPCQHSFCKLCLERLAEDRWSRCPQCRKSFRVPFNGGVNAFDVNRTIVQLMESLPKKDHVKPLLRAKCAICRKEEVISACEHCKEATCKPCRTAHYNELKEDLIQKIKKINTDNDVILYKEVETIEKHQQNIQYCIQTKDLIKLKAQEIINKIKEKESKLLEEIDDFQRGETTMMNDNNSRIKDIEEICHFCESSTEKLEKKDETDNEVTEIKLNCDIYSRKTKEFGKDLPKRTISNSISFIANEIEYESLSLGHIETQIASNDENTKEKFETLEMQLRQLPRHNSLNIRGNRNIPAVVAKAQFKNNQRSIIDTKKNFQNYKTIGHEGTEDAEFRHPLGVAVSPINGSIYVADSWNNRIQIFNSQGTHLRSIEKLGDCEFHYPYSIHIDKIGHVYVSDQSQIRIKVFDSEFNFKRSIGRYGRESGCYTGLCDVSTDNDNNVYVCDSGNHRILKFSANGEFKMEWGKSGSLLGQFKCPACITVHDECIFVSDWGNHRVQVFSLEGTFLKSIGNHGSGPGEFKRPLGIAVDDHGNVVIVDEGNNRIQLFKADLTFHSKISGLKCGFQRPWDIAITKSGGIVVSEYYGHRLQIF